MKWLRHNASPLRDDMTGCSQPMTLQFSVFVIVDRPDNLSNPASDSSGAINTLDISESKFRGGWDRSSSQFLHPYFSSTFLAPLRRLSKSVPICVLLLPISMAPLK